MPIDLIAFTRVEVTWQLTQRIEMQPLGYSDVARLRPDPSYAASNLSDLVCVVSTANLPLALSGGSVPRHISYRTSPPLAQLATDSNILLQRRRR